MHEETPAAVVEGSWPPPRAISRAETASLQIRGGRDAPHSARQAIRALLARRLTARELEDASLLVTELVANSVRHADMGPDVDIGVDVLVFADRLRLCVIDSGSTQIPRLVGRRPHEPRGFGLVVVDRLSLGWGVARSGSGVTRTWCELALASAANASGDIAPPRV
jgi:anti-sigma regulatory factor (Ser/Thr protein kinase)